MIKSKINIDNSFGGNFTEDRIKEEWEMTDIVYGGSFFKPVWNGNQWIEGLNILEISVQQERANKDYIKSKYEIHKVNGWNEYQDFRAQVITDINAQIISETQAFLLEDYLKDAYNKISSTGDWKTARWVLTQLAGHELWMQPYIDSALSRVNVYITNNYDF